MKQNFTIGVFAIIKDDQDRVLLCLRNDYEFRNLPGGSLEKGETPWQGVVREIKEETGLDAEVVRLAGIYSKPDKDEIVFSFECRVTGGMITLNEEAKDIQYFSFHELPKNTPPKNVERIEDAFKNKNEPVMKVRTGESTMERFKKL